MMNITSTVRRTMDTQALLDKLEQLNAIGVALSREEHITLLLERILHSAMDLTGADAGTIYLTNARQALEFRILSNRSLGIELGGTGGGTIDLPDIPLFDDDGQPNDRMVAAHAAARQRTVSIEDAERAEGFDFSGTREFNRLTGYVSRSFLTVPLIDHHRDSIGVLQLINAMDPGTRAIRAFTQEDQRLAESLASQAAIAYTKRRLIDQLAELFEALVTLINNAIDEKSPYTSKHCERVPVLTMMIAIGQFTPPMAVNLMVSCRIAGVSMESTIPWVAWLVAATTLAAAAVMALPDLALWLPRMMGLG